MNSTPDKPESVSPGKLSRFFAFFPPVTKSITSAFANANAGADEDVAIRQIGYSAVALLLAVFLLWSAFASIDSAALAPGVVQVEGKRKPIQHLEGGIVSAILVETGESVEADQPLILLDAASDRAEREIIQGRLFNSKAKLGRLTSERDDLSSVVFDPALHDAAADDIRAAEAIINETAIFEARLADRRGEAAVLQSRIEGDSAVLQSKRAIDKSLSAEMTDLSELLADGYVDNRRLRELERMRTENLGQITDIEVSIEETGLRILQLQKRFKTEVVDALTRTREQFHDLQQQFLAIDDRVKRATIRAPVSGTAMNIGPNSVGAVIGSGQTLMEIVPELNRLVVEARISPMDIDAVAIGQSAEVRFAVFKDAYSVTGTLIKLSADRLVDEDSQLPYYAAVVKLDEEDFYLLEGLTLIPGMPAEVLVKTGQRTFIGYLTSPLSRLFSRSLIED